MFCHKQDYLKIEKIQYKALKIVYNINESYEELLLCNNDVSIHQKQFRILGRGGGGGGICVKCNKPEVGISGWGGGGRKMVNRVPFRLV